MVHISPDAVRMHGEYAIAFVKIGPQRVAHISEQAFQDIVLSTNNWRNFVNIEEKYDIMMENFCEFERACFDIALRHMLFEIPDDIFLGETALLNRNLLNYLTSTTMYIDQTKRHLTNVCGRGSPEIAQFNELLVSLKNSNAGMFILEHLRNFAQHASGAIDSISIGGSRSQLNQKDITVYDVFAAIDLDGLRNDRKSGERVANRETELRGRSVQDLMRDAADGLSCLHDAVREMLRDKIGSARNSIEAGIAVYDDGLISGADVNGLAAIKFSSHGIMIDKAYISKHQIERFDSFVRKNQRLSDLRKRRVMS
ncbi:hypothetical protein [Methylorubrum sp. SB2]|uniref:hypothetical protein n=1 Tax=Methylorubrum subtropicum TaxID=3138812 RepID=UPI00313CFCF9